MNVSFTERLMELNNARERSLISEEEYCMLRLKIFDAFTSSSTPSTTSSVTQYPQPQQQPLSSPNDKSQQQHVTFSQQTFNSSPAKPLSGKTKIPSAQSVHSSNSSLSSTQQSPQSPRLLSRQINDNISNNIMNDSSTPENVIGTNSVSPTNQIYIPKRTRSSLASHALQETNINSNEELSVKTTRGLSTLSESQHTTTTSASIKSPSSPPPSMSSSIPILKTTIRDSSASKKNLSMNRSTPMAYINPDSTSLFAHNNSTNNHNVTTNIVNHNELNNGEINNKNEENHLTNGRITSYDNMNAMGHNDENVNTNNDDNGINSGVMCHTSINNGVMNQSDERTEMIQTSVNRMNFMNKMNGNSDDDDRLVSSLQPFSQSQSAPLPQQRQNINSVTLSARQIRSRSLGPNSVLSSDNDTNNNNINNSNNNYNNNDNDNNNGSSNSNSFTNRLRNRNSHGNLNTRRSLNFGEVMNSLNRGGDLVETDQYEQSVPEVPPPPYSPPESSLRFHRRRSSTPFFLRPKTSAELRKELLKLTEESKKEQDSWRIEEARLRMRINSKPEEIERVKRKMRESNEKYRKKIEAVTAKLRQLSFNNMDGN